MQKTSPAIGVTQQSLSKADHLALITKYKAKCLVGDDGAKYRII